jgi:hypothetical protein
VIAVMVIQFQSFIEPLVVLFAAPLSFVGAIGLLLVTGTPLNVSSFMGLILLVGLIVKNGIILLDFTRHLMRFEGLPLDEALRGAARIRLRPILMTTLCTLFGLLPLALGLGAGSDLQRPLALAVIGGLALSTPITLFIVPNLLVAIRGREHRLAPRGPSIVSYVWGPWSVVHGPWSMVHGPWSVVSTDDGSRTDASAPVLRPRHCLGAWTVLRPAAIRACHLVNARTLMDARAAHERLFTPRLDRFASWGVC